MIKLDNNWGYYTEIKSNELVYQSVGRVFEERRTNVSEQSSEPTNSIRM